jgi:hypothetical protein
MNEKCIVILAIDEPGGNRNLKININAQQKIRKSHNQNNIFLGIPGGATKE